MRSRLRMGCTGFTNGSRRNRDVQRATRRAAPSHRPAWAAPESPPATSSSRRHGREPDSPAAAPPVTIAPPASAASGASATHRASPCASSSPSSPDAIAPPDAPRPPPPTRAVRRGTGRTLAGPAPLAPAAPSASSPPSPPSPIRAAHTPPALDGRRTPSSVTESSVDFLSSLHRCVRRTCRSSA